VGGEGLAYKTKNPERLLITKISRLSGFYGGLLSYVLIIAYQKGLSIVENYLTNKTFITVCIAILSKSKIKLTIIIVQRFVLFF